MSSAPPRQTTRVAVEFQRRAGQRRLDSGSGLVVADEPVGEPERQRVHRTRGRHADGPIADAPRPILHRGLRAGGDNLNACRPGRRSSEGARQHLAAGEDVEARQLPEIIEVGLEPADLGRVERGLQLAQRFVAGGAR